MIKERLNAFEGSIREVARVAGVSHSTVLGIKDGSRENPGIATVRKIEEALDQLEAAAAASREEVAP